MISFLEAVAQIVPIHAKTYKTKGCKPIRSNTLRSPQSETLIKLYLHHAEMMSIPDEQWTEKQITCYFDTIEPAAKIYSNAFDNINFQQVDFADLNGAEILDN